MKTYVIEDEEPALQRLQSMLQEITDIEIIGHSASGKKAIIEIDAIKPELLLLDIHLTDMSGLDVLQLIKTKPAVIFTTAYDQYAVQAFELRAVDFLLKPYSQSRLEEAISRVRENENAPAAINNLLAHWQPPASYLTRFASRIGDKIFMFSEDEIVYFISESKFVYACLENQRYLLNNTLSQLETRLDPEKFFRIHRSSIVNLNYVRKIEADNSGGYEITTADNKNSKLSVSRTAGKALRKKLGW
ncbi:MAG: DNA-binding response regulator [Calditrichaeota bacterium]|nr:MAG: DNA-binding response regulator [Calditrichota bacterium]